MNTEINWDKIREQTKSRAKFFVEELDCNKSWCVAGEIVDSAVIFNVWDENIHEVCKYQLEHGLMAQPKMAEYLIKRNS